MLNLSPDELYDLVAQVLVPITVCDVLSDNRFRFISINPTHMEKSGLEAEAFIGRGPQDLLPDDEAAHVLRRYGEAARSGRAQTYDEFLTLPSGQHWWRTSISPIKSQAGWVGRLCVSSIPVDLEVRLRELVKDLSVDMHAIRSSQPVITSAVEGTIRSLESVTRITEALRLAGNRLSHDERQLVELLGRLASTANESLRHARRDGLDRIGDIVDQSLLTQGAVAGLLDEIYEPA